MAIQTVFKRYELKYMISAEQKEKLLEVLAPYMTLDKYGRTTICNLYFDTDSYLLIRRSIEKPTYKEKLRIRRYSGDERVFVELKKKYKKVVYKRRICMSAKAATDWLCRGKKLAEETQISREIDYFISGYEGLEPKVFLSYEREAYYSNDGTDFRVTFDENVLSREEDLSFDKGVYGTPLLPEGLTLMEIKGAGGMPLWMAEALSQLKIYKTSFSKYGTAYKNIIFPKLTKEDTPHGKSI